MEREQVQEAIDTAFGGLPIPKPRTIIGDVDSRNRSDAEAFRREIAGKSWQSLTPEFLAKGQFAFCYLSSKAYRYYLPALLTMALKEFQNDGKRIHSVVFGLRPSFWSLYYEGNDRAFEANASALTPTQYRAVCAFLGLVFDRLPRLKYLAAQALHWGWNQIDSPALAAANTYYHTLHTFSYPEAEDPEIAALYREISAAFATTPYPGDDKLCDSEQGDEPQEIAMELRSVKWQSAHPDLLARCDTALSFLTDAGFRYFLPAYLMADLSDYESNASPVLQLTRGLYGTSMDMNNPIICSAVRSLFVLM